MKTIIALTLLFLSSLAAAQQRVFAYSPGGMYNPPVIVYTYTQSDGTIGLAHCRAATTTSFQNAFSTYTTLDLNSCDLSYQAPAAQSSAPTPQVNAPTPLAF